MKQLFSFIVVFFIFFSSSINCFAADYEEAHMGNVFAKINYPSNSKIYTTSSNDGQYTIVTDDGVRITVYSNKSNVVLVVHQITKDEKDSFAWLESCVPQSISRFIPYDIFFLNINSERIELSSEEKVVITFGAKQSIAFGVSCDGSIIDISYSINGNTISFTATDKYNYYLLGEQISDIKSNPTGDMGNNIYLWMNILLMSLMCLLFSAKKLFPINYKQQ